MRFALLVALAAGFGCSSGSGHPDSGPADDGGGDAGPLLSDGGALGASCTSLATCGGNPICSDEQQCSVNVSCAAGGCATAGGPANGEAVSLGFGGTAASPLPTYLQVYLLAPELVAGGTLDCPTLLGGIDAGTLSPLDITQINPLVLTYDLNVGGITASEALMFDLASAATGTSRVLYIEGYLDIGEPDGGAQLLGRVCTTFDDTDGGLGMTSATLDSFWP